MNKEVETQDIEVAKVKEVKHHSEWKGAGPKWSAGVQTSEGDWININKFKKEDVDNIMENVEEGREYRVFSEISGDQGQYKNVKSFVLKEDINQDPHSHASDEELGKEQDEVFRQVGSGGHPIGTSSQQTLPQASTIASREERKQLMIVRQSALNYATQLAGVFYSWRIKENFPPGDNDKIDLEYMKNQIKEIAKEYEEQVMRK